MRADAIERVTKSLRKRLERAVIRAGTSSGSSEPVFVGPLDDPDSTGAMLILFLYRIVPNANLRNNDRRLDLGNGKGIASVKGSLPLDLYYLLSVGTMPNASEIIPLRTLGFAMRELHQLPLLNVAESGQTSETTRVTLEPLSTEESGRIWALFPAVNYRTSVAYLVSPVWIDPDEPEDVGPPVVQDSLQAGSKAELSI